MAFVRQRVAVFVDGDFWHGRDWELRRVKLSVGHNAGYWLSKISYNMERDRRVDAQLATAGWKVVRFWETDILRDPERIAQELLREVRLRVWG